MVIVEKLNYAFGVPQRACQMSSGLLGDFLVGSTGDGAAAGVGLQRGLGSAFDVYRERVIVPALELAPGFDSALRDIARAAAFVVRRVDVDLVPTPTLEGSKSLRHHPRGYRCARLYPGGRGTPPG